MKRALAFLLPVAAFTFLPSVARAENKSFVDRPIALGTLHAQFEAGLGLGQYADPTTGQKWGSGANLEAGIGLPFFGELSVRAGYRFGDPGKLADPSGLGVRPNGLGGDYYARPFDHESSNFGTDPWSNPEIRLRGQLFDLEVVQVGLETRFIVPLANGTEFSASPGAPVRIHIPGLM